MNHSTPTPQQESFSFSELFQALWKGKGYIFFTVLTAALLAFVYLKVTTPIYEATSIVYVNTEPSYNEVLSGTATSKGERKLENEVGLLKYSKALALEVAKRIDETARKDTPNLTIIHDPKTGRRLTVSEIAGALKYYVDFNPVSGMDMIEITVESPEPEEAALIANLYAHVYQDYSRQVQRKDISATRRSLEEQESRLARKIRELELQRENYLRKYNIPAMGENGEHLVARLSELEDQREQTQVELEQATIALKAIRSKLARLKPEDIAEFSSLKSEITALDEKIAELKVQEEDFYAINPEFRTSSKKPRELSDLIKRIQRYKARKEELSQRLVDKASASGLHSPEDIENLTLLRQEMNEKETEVNGLRSKLKLLDRNIQQVKNQLAVFPERATMLAQLERERETAMQSRMEILRKLHEARMAEEAEKGYVEIVHNATPPTLPAKPHPLQLMVLAIFIGLFIGIGIAILRQNIEASSSSPSPPSSSPTPSDEPVPPVLARIPQLWFQTPARQTSWQSIQEYTYDPALVFVRDPWSPTAETFRHLILRIQEHLGTAPRTLLITSPETGEGKTFVAANLATALARAGRRVLYLDTNPHPSENGARFFGMPRVRGNGHSVTDWSPFKTSIAGLYYAPAQTLGLQPTISRKHLSSRLAQLEHLFDTVILDAPAATHPTVQRLVSTQPATLLVTIYPPSTPQVQQAVETLRRTGAQVIGLILNRQQEEQVYTQPPVHAQGYLL